MSDRKKVYLAGPISGLQYDSAQDWRIQVKRNLDSHGIDGYSPLRAKEYLRTKGVLEQGYEDTPLSTDRGITTRDRWDVMTSDAVLFNMLGAERVSIGTCIEFGWADAFRKPIILVIEEDRKNIHDYPIIREVTGFRTNTLENAVQIICRVLLP